VSSADASYEAALEAAFEGENAVPGQNILFSRVRIRMDGLVAGATHHITHPYGVLDLVATPVDGGGGEIGNPLTPTAVTGGPFD
jgi:hypothetical protein